VKLIKQNKGHNKDKYVVAISFEKYIKKETVTSNKKGCIGVDINQDHLAVSELDRNGNLLEIKTFNYDLNGTTHQNTNSISLAVKELMLYAQSKNKTIVIEELDFSKKKKELKSGVNKKRNKQLSSFAYGKIIGLIKARSEDYKIEVREVNPAYTSKIGGIKYSPVNKISIHHAAAMCIGRKDLLINNKKDLKRGYVERLIKRTNRQVIKYFELPDGVEVAVWIKQNRNNYWRAFIKKRLKIKNSNIITPYEEDSASNLFHSVNSQSTVLSPESLLNCSNDDPSISTMFSTMNTFDNL
jgi:IS605 OrfB family transposase